jgi:hypothetical protein
MNKMIAQQFIYHFLSSMNLLNALNSLLPELHSYRDEDRRFHMGCTWHARDGLREFHDLELRYSYNSERLACKEKCVPMGVGATQSRMAVSTPSLRNAPGNLWKYSSFSNCHGGNARQAQGGRRSRQHSRSRGSTYLGAESTIEEQLASPLHYGWGGLFYANKQMNDPPTKEQEINALFRWQLILAPIPI